jgi:hypothetical protein
MSVPAAAAARAVPASPSGWAMRWKATGATRSGIETRVPSTVVSVDTSVTSQRTRGRRRQRANASTFQRSVRSSSAPPAK